MISAISTTKKSATAFAPATVANVAVGFDLLGFPIDGVGDQVTVSKSDAPGKVSILEITPGDSKLPTDPGKNTATIGLLKLCRDRKLTHGFEVSIQKGIAIGSGMGGSAASAVAAIVAANALLDRPLSLEEQIEYALEGESVASGSRHADNVAPCLLGGLTLSCASDGRNPGRFVKIPVSSEVFCVLIHPEIRVDTKTARGILKTEVSLKDHVRQSAHLAAFLAGCFKSDIRLIGESLTDVLIEPQRAHLIPGFAEVKAAAMRTGALGCSISGSGPSVFALVAGKSAATAVRKAMLDAFAGAGVTETQAWISPIRSEGAKLL